MSYIEKVSMHSNKQMGKNKNVHGGSGYKKFANKSFATNKTTNRLRISEDESEIYAIVLKMHGFGTFQCFCIDGKSRLCHISGKFKGRFKRDNMVEVGKWVLVGLRTWCSKTDQCDLLEIYADSDKKRLKENVNCNWQTLEEQDRTKTEEELESDIIFGTERDFERARLEEEMKSNTLQTVQMSETKDEEDWAISVDDI